MDLIIYKKQLMNRIKQANNWNNAPKFLQFVFFLNVKEKCQKHDCCVELRNLPLTFSFSGILNTLLGPGWQETMYWTEKKSFNNIITIFTIIGSVLVPFLFCDKHSDKKNKGEERIYLAYTSKSQFLFEET